MFVLFFQLMFLFILFYNQQFITWDMVVDHGNYTLNKRKIENKIKVKVKVK